MSEIYEEIVKIKAKREKAVLVTIISAISSTPREEGTKMLVRADGSILGSIGGGSVEYQVRDKAVDIDTVSDYYRALNSLRK